jgi:hypothetical protein
MLVHQVLDSVEMRGDADAEVTNPLPDQLTRALTNFLGYDPRSPN